MADKYTDDKLYKVVRKDGSHLNTKVNPDGTKSALQFTDDNNDLMDGRFWTELYYAKSNRLS